MARRWLVGILLGVVLGLMPARGAQAAGRLFAIEVVDEGSAAYQIVELNPNTLKIIRGIPLPQSQKAGDGGALAYDGANLWYINGFTGAYLYRLDPETGAVRQRYPLLSTDTPDDYPVGLAISLPSRQLIGPRAGIVYILNKRGSIQVFDPEAGTVLRVLHTDGHGDLVFIGNHLVTCGPNQLPHGRPWEVDQNTGSLSDYLANVVTATFEVNEFEATGLAEVNGLLYVALGDRRIAVYSLANDGTFLAQTTVLPDSPHEIQFSDLAGGQEDTDQDGISNDDDHSPNSILTPFVDVGSGPTTVRNGVDRSGVSIQDKVVEAQRLSLGDDRDYLRRIQALADELRAQGIITDAQVKELVKGARRSGK